MFTIATKVHSGQMNAATQDRNTGQISHNPGNLFTTVAAATSPYVVLHAFTII
jgi:hypothetical protein